MILLRTSTWRFVGVAALLALGTGAHAHEVPNDVTVQTIIRPEGKVLSFLCVCRSKPCVIWRFRNVTAAIWT